MNWYQYFFKIAEGQGDAFGGIDESFDEAVHLYASLAKAIGESPLATKEDLQELTRAFNDYRKGVRIERTTSAVSAV